MAIAVQLDLQGATLDQYDRITKRSGRFLAGQRHDTRSSTGQRRPRTAFESSTCGSHGKRSTPSPGRSSLRSSRRSACPIRRRCSSSRSTTISPGTAGGIELRPRRRRPAWEHARSHRRSFTGSRRGSRSPWRTWPVAGRLACPAAVPIAPRRRCRPRRPA